MKKRIIAGILVVAAVLAAGIGFSSDVLAVMSCGNVNTSIINCSSTDGSGAINEILNTAINVMMALIGVTAVGFMVFAGYQYMTSAGDPGKMAKAKNRIVQIIIGLVVYAVMWAVLEFLVPGGVLNSFDRAGEIENAKPSVPENQVTGTPGEEAGHPNLNNGNTGTPGGEAGYPILDENGNNG